MSNKMSIGTYFVRHLIESYERGLDISSWERLVGREEAHHRTDTAGEFTVTLQILCHAQAVPLLKLTIQSIH